MGRRESARFRRRRQAWWEVQSGATARQALDVATQHEFVAAIDRKRRNLETGRHVEAGRLGDRCTDPVDAIERALTRAPTGIAHLCDHDHHLGPGGSDADGSRPTDAVEHVDSPFDRSRRNRTGRRADHVAGSATNPESAVGVDRPDIAGGVRAVGGRGEVRCVPQAVVAEPLMGGPHPNLAEQARLGGGKTGRYTELVEWIDEELDAVDEYDWRAREGTRAVRCGTVQAW